VYHTKGKWVSKHDDNIIKSYLRSGKGGYDGILAYQWGIRERELEQRHKMETDKWDLDLAQVPSLPGDWIYWVSKVGVPENYIYYQYVKRGAKTGYCTFCEKEVPIKKPRHNKKGRCPRCHKEITFKASGRAGCVETNKKDMFLLQRCKDGVILRYFEGYRRYRKNNYHDPDCRVWEYRRVIYNHNAVNPRVYYWGNYKQRGMRWIPGVLLDATYTYWSGPPKGLIYKKSLRSLFKRELKRTGLKEAIAHYRVLSPEQYLAVYERVPILEQLVKAKLPRLADECLTKCGDFVSKVTTVNANSLTKSLCIDTQALKRLRENNGGWRFLEWLQYEKESDKPIPDAVIDWFCQEQIVAKDLRFIRNRMSVLQVYNYLRRQMADNKATSGDVLGTWEDYLSMAKYLKLDTNDAIIYRVNKLYKRHNALVKRCKNEKNIAIEAGRVMEEYPGVEEVCRSLKEKYEYADDMYTVIAPSGVADIMLEGKNLNHCVGSSDRYWERIQNRVAFVLFLRKTADVKKSYYTLEVEPNGTIRQKRTFFDRQNADIKDAAEFLIKWQNVVAERLTAEDRELAERSRVQRIDEYAQLREQKVVIQYGDLQGRLLADVLLADLMETAA
jgi:hypothetical protein